MVWPVNVEGLQGRILRGLSTSRSMAINNEIRIVLVEPEHPGNIGAAARAMKTMGLRALHLVKPNRFPDPQADWRSAGALEIVADAVVHDNLDSAIEDCGYVVGTSARSRYVPLPVMSASEFGRLLNEGLDTDEPVAVLFGRESDGLTNDELMRCNKHIRIPANPEYQSLNLAMAVQVVTYEIFKGSEAPETTRRDWDRSLAKAGDVEYMLKHLESVCDRIRFFKPGGSRHALVRFRRLFNRIEMDETEVKLLRGFFSHIERTAAEKHPADENA